MRTAGARRPDNRYYVRPLPGIIESRRALVARGPVARQRAAAKPDEPQITGAPMCWGAGQHPNTVVGPAE